jgi:cytidyltransferase-like protein
MILAFEDLHAYRGRVAMVDGCFDPLHRGHISYFRAAASLGLPVLCNIAPDAYLATKHPPLLPQAHRAEVIDAIRYIDYTHSSAVSTAEVLRELRPQAYVKGADWREKGLPEHQDTIARELGIEVVYLDTVLDSSSGILKRYLESRQERVEA